MRVTKGIDARRIARRTAGDKARRKGLATKRRVVRFNKEEAVCMSRGRWTRRRAVRMQRTRGMIENKRRL